jgi:hypothetical protein
LAGVIGCMFSLLHSAGKDSNYRIKLTGLKKSLSYPLLLELLITADLITLL